jgi:hypothetical protein
MERATGRLDHSILELWYVRWERFELALERLSPEAWSSFVG